MPWQVLDILMCFIYYLCQFFPINNFFIYIHSNTFIDMCMLCCIFSNDFCNSGTPKQTKVDILLGYVVNNKQPRHNRQKNYFTYQFPLPTMHTLFGLPGDILLIVVLVALKLHRTLGLLIIVRACNTVVNSRPIVIRREQPIICLVGGWKIGKKVGTRYQDCRVWTLLLVTSFARRKSENGNLYYFT